MLTLIRQFIGSKSEPCFIIDDEIKNEAVVQSVEPMIAHTLLSMSVDEQNRDKNQELVYKQIVLFSHHLAAQKELNDLLIPAGITPVVLKGISASYYYPQPELRVLGDIDILPYPVSDENFDKAKEILLENGFVESGTTDKRTSFDKNGVHYELHRHFSQRRTEEQINLDEYIENSIPQKKTINEYEFYSLPDEVIGLLYLDHMAQHLFREGLGLRQIIDWVVYSNNYLSDERWNESFGKKADTIGLKQFAQTVDKLGTIYLGGNKHLWSAIADDKACKELLELVYQVGNFGQKMDAASSRVTTKINRQLSKSVSPIKRITQIPYYVGKLVSKKYSVKSVLNGYKEHRERKKIFEKIGMGNYK